MPHAVCPRTTKSLINTPNHLAPTMTQVLLIFPTIKNTILPEKLTNAIHLPLFPLTSVALAVKPSISSLTMEFIVLELTLIVLQKLSAAVMFDKNILIKQH